MSAIFDGLAGYGGMETEEEKRRRLASLIDPLAGINTDPDPG